MVNLQFQYYPSLKDEHLCQFIFGCEEITIFQQRMMIWKNASVLLLWTAMLKSSNSDFAPWT